MNIKHLKSGLLVTLGLAVLGGGTCPGTGTGIGIGTGAGTGTGAGGMSAAERQLATDALTAMNNHRAGLGLAPFTWYEAGALVAYDHCVAMQVGGFFAHIDFKRKIFHQIQGCGLTFFQGLQGFLKFILGFFPDLDFIFQIPVDFAKLLCPFFDFSL